MKKIGEGYYYNVYDLGNGRVLKKLKSKVRMFFYILISRKGNSDFLREYRKALQNIKIIQQTYTRITTSGLDMSFLGNPVFLSGINYEQDKVSPIYQLLTVASTNEIQDIIEQFISGIKTLWRHGIVEEVYNFTINNGVAPNGRVVLLDFNEVAFEKEQALKDIETQVWIKRWSYSHLSPDLKEYYKKRMQEELTIPTLDSLWRSSC